MSVLFELAKRIAKIAHSDQVDKAGQPYIDHPLAVCEKVSGETEKIVALLHDVIEDSETTLDDIREAGFGEDVVTALDCITKRDGEVYTDYLSRVAGNEVARVVKLADLSHNMDTSRLREVSEKDIERLQKYKYAVSFLSET